MTSTSRLRCVPVIVVVIIPIAVGVVVTFVVDVVLSTSLVLLALPRPIMLGDTLVAGPVNDGLLTGA